MREEARNKWDQEDRELAQEFEAVSAMWHEDVHPTPPVPPALDRKIHEQAKYRIGEELQGSWILGHAPRLMLAVCLLFGIGVLFVVALEQERKQKLATGASSPEARITEPMASLAGEWKGDNSLWLFPGDTEKRSQTTARVTPLSDHAWSMNYAWAFDGKPVAGTLVITGHSGSGRLHATWVDGWHMGDKTMDCEGSILPDGSVALSGHYAAPPDPDWGWRIEIQPESIHRFQLRMYNITPKGEEALAVRADYIRVKAAL